MPAPEPMFPILNDPIIKAIPWAALAPHEQQAKRNHSQSLSQLARRGGLSIEEAYCVLKDTAWPMGLKWNQPNVRIALMRLITPPREAAVGPQKEASHGQ